MKQLADGTWIRGGGGVSSHNAIAHGSNGMPKRGHFGAGGAGSHDFGIRGPFGLVKHSRLKFKIPEGITSISYEINDGQVKIELFDDAGTAVTQMIIDLE